MVQRLRRYEDFKCWSELEDLGSYNDKFLKQFNDYKVTNENALQEILEHLEKVVRDCPSKEEFEKELDLVRERIYGDVD